MYIYSAWWYNDTTRVVGTSDNRSRPAVSTGRIIITHSLESCRFAEISAERVVLARTKVLLLLCACRVVVYIRVNGVWV